MKPRNFPAKRLARKLRAEESLIAEYNPKNVELLREARGVRTKKRRSARGAA